MDAITVSGLVKSYGSVKAVDGLNMHVKTGEVFGMLGPNGAGKTTTVEILVGLRMRDKGEISVLGLDPGKQVAELRRRIGVQLQSGGLYPRLTVREAATLFASFYEDPMNPEEVIDRIGLSSKANAAVQTLSGGQRQRLAVALALVSNADVIFLDEPTTGLDPQARRSLWNVIDDLRLRGVTVLLTTHYMEEAEQLCDHVAIVDHGRQIAYGSPATLISEHFKEQAVEFSVTGPTDMEKFEAIPGVSSVTLTEDRATMYTLDAGATIASMMGAASDSGQHIQDVTVRHATLEDVFLKLTGRRIRE